MKYSVKRFKFIRLTLFFIITIKGGNIFAQEDFRKIIPLSPNAASFVKYGEIPVSTFTGVPSIEIPLYNISSGELRLDLNLGYHAGGNKVEAIASWVGLGWSINGLPNISRSVNGLPDEGIGGCFSLYGGKTISELNDLKGGASDLTYRTYMAAVKDNTADSEPDVFNFSINGQSGKFLYNQDLQKFIAFPKSNIKIEYIGTDFQIIGSDGIKYYYQEKEVTTMSSSITTSWMITKIINPSLTDTITFNYEVEFTAFRTITPAVKYQIIDGRGCSSTSPANSGGDNVISNVLSKTLSEIHFKGGYLKFVKSSTEREDLIGGHSLNEMQVFSNTNTMLRKIKFNYSYIQGGSTGYGCVIGDTYKSNKWMFLNEVKNYDSNSTNPDNYTFQYDQNAPSCRNSPAQDYWGYYNGSTLNVDLVPTTTIPGTSLQIPGADRAVNPSFTQFGILKRISYPTGGFSEFDYENNDAQDTIIPRVYADRLAYVAGEGEEDLPTIKEYINTFTINNPIDPVLNNSNPNGGAFINVDIGGIGVPPGSVGATLRIRGVSPNNSYINFNFSYNFSNYYVPNGEYEIYASFNQNPPNYQNFYYFASWKVVDSNFLNSFTGGLRVKEIRRYTSSLDLPLVKQYRYKNEYESAISSGNIFGSSILNFGDSFDQPIITDVSCSIKYFMVKSYSNQTQVTHSGSYVGYKKVFIQTDSPSETGVTSYEYTFDKDIEQGGFPYPPAQSTEAIRGQVKEVNEFKLEFGLLSLIKSLKYEYATHFYDTLSIKGIKTSAEAADPAYSLVPYASIPANHFYELPPVWSAVAQVTERNYDSPTNYLEKSTFYTYDTEFKHLVTTKSYSSNNRELLLNNYYPNDLSLSGNAETARLWLLAKNNVDEVLKTERFQESVLINSIEIDYKNFDGGDLVKPFSIKQNYGSSFSPKTTFFSAYNEKGNLTEQYVDTGPKTSYLYSYNGRLPIAEIKNAAYATIETLLGTSTINTTSNFTNPSQTTITSFLSPLTLALPNAMISSYVYDPMSGIKSQTDAKGMTTYYEYDSFQRLKNIKDQDGNIIKSYCYNYAGQITDCNGYTGGAGNLPLLTEFPTGYSPYKYDVCSLGTLNEVPILFSPIYSNAINIDAPVLIGQPSPLFYLDSSKSGLAVDGYYTLWETDMGHSGYKMYYINEGAYLFTAWCDVADPAH